jgi:hypothetical protein
MPAAAALIIFGDANLRKHCFKSTHHALRGSVITAELVRHVLQSDSIVP